MKPDEICANCGHHKILHKNDKGRCTSQVFLKQMESYKCPCKKFTPQNHSPHFREKQSRVDSSDKLELHNPDLTPADKEPNNQQVSDLTEDATGDGSDAELKTHEHIWEIIIQKGLTREQAKELERQEAIKWVKYWRNLEGIPEKGNEYADMSLYQEIILLKHFFKGKWVIENTMSYYEPLITPQYCGNHYFWSNFNIGRIKLSSSRAVSVTRLNEKSKKVGFNIDSFDLSDMKDSHKKDKVLNNCVEPELGLHILKMAFKELQQTLQ